MTLADLSFWEGIKDTASGRGQLRFIIQPTIALILGIRLGIGDAKAGEDPFVKRLILDHRRKELLMQALKKIVVPFCLAIVLDSVLQYLALGYFRIGAAIFVGILLVGVPFSVSRAFTNRIYRRSHQRHEATPKKKNPNRLWRR